MSGPTFQRADGVRLRRVGSEAMLLDPRDDSMHVLNPVAAAVWELLATPRTLADVVAELELAFEVGPGDDVARDVERLLAELGQSRLVVSPAVP